MNLRFSLLPKPIRWLLVLVLAVFIFYVSIVTTPPPETAINTAKPDLVPLDKWRHFVAYAAFGGSLAYAWADSGRSLRTTMILIFTITVLYVIGIEFGQSMVPNRYFSCMDAYANALGGILVTPWYFVRPHVDFTPLNDLFH